MYTVARPLPPRVPRANRRPPVPIERAAESAAVYRPRKPTYTPLYRIVQHHLETFLARAAEADPLGDGVPFWELELDFDAELDQTPAFDPADPEPFPDFDFDQTRGG